MTRQWLPSLPSGREAANSRHYVASAVPCAPNLPLLLHEIARTEMMWCQDSTLGCAEVGGDGQEFPCQNHAMGRMLKKWQAIRSLLVEAVCGLREMAEAPTIVPGLW